MNAQETRESMNEKSGQTAKAAKGGDRSCCTTSCCGGAQTASNLDSIEQSEKGS